MPKLQRKSAKLFAENATATAGGIAQFGSLAAGTPNYSTDPDVIQGLQQYSDGWSAAVLGTKSPALEDRNALDFLLSYQQAYIMQRGVPEWISTETYYQGSFVSLSDGRMYVSKIDNNTNKNPSADTSETYWLRFPTPAEVAAKVSKSGDTMTGQLEMSGTGTSAIKLNVTNVTDKFKDIAAYNGDDRFAGLRLEYTGQAARVAGLYARDTNSNISQLRIYYDSNNNVITSAPACDVNNSIVTTVAKSKSVNGYYKLGNGLIIQWGRSSASNRTVTFPTPFTTNCQVAGNCNWTSTTNDGHGYVYNITTTGFEFRGVDDDMLPFHWIAVGY